MSDETPGENRDGVNRPTAETDPEAAADGALGASPPDDAAEGHPLSEADAPPGEETQPEADPAPPPAVAPAPAPRRPRPAPPRRDQSVRRPGLLGKVLRRLVILLLVFGLVLPVVSTVVFKFVPPPITILMIQRMFEGKGLDRRWVSLSKMSPALPNAVIAAEDARYCSHWGFDFEAMEKAMAHNERRPGKIRGGSTISQQTAKNVFLWPQRSYVRKGLEAYFTVLIETLWGKRRIMEVYLNTVEWGPGIYGADSAARRYFGVGADDLTPAQAARLAAILPSPLKWKAAKPGPYVKKRSKRIGAASGTVRREGLAACVR